MSLVTVITFFRSEHPKGAIMLAPFATTHCPVVSPSVVTFVTCASAYLSSPMQIKHTAVKTIFICPQVVCELPLSNSLDDFLEIAVSWHSYRILLQLAIPLRSNIKSGPTPAQSSVVPQVWQMPKPSPGLRHMA